MQVTCGIDWAEDHHDVAVVDSDARLLGKPPDNDGTHRNYRTVRVRQARREGGREEPAV